nr:glycosyltransferase [uncultured Oscillibacter sp.]
MSKIYLQTVVYNAGETIARCVGSILNQTYSGELEWHILDNGSTDNTYLILKEYAERFAFIQLSHIDKNCDPQDEKEHRLWNQVCKRSGIDLSDNDFYCMLDGDDEYEPDFFEEMLSFVEKYNLDVAVAGNTFIDAKSGSVVGARKVEKSLILDTPVMYAELFPFYHAFMRPVWGKLFKGKTVKNYIRRNDLVYGNDTHFVFHTLRRASRVGILNKSLYRYYVSPKSVSYKYRPGRFSSDTYLYDDAIDFLSAFGPVSAQNRNFLQCVYSNAMSDTIGVIRASSLSTEEKLREYRRIAENPITLGTYRECMDESVRKCKALLLQAALEAGAAQEKREDKDLRTLAQLLLPRCGQTVNKGNARMFLEAPPLLRALVQDDADAMMETLLERIEDGRESKRYDAAGMICALAVEKPLLCQIDNAVFLRKYAGIYRKVWQGDFLAALDEMTGLLLENKVSGGREMFLTLFISLAAVEEQVPAFIFGKMQLAGLYLRQGRREQARVIVSDLTDMGVEDAELEILRRESQESDERC